ncbi:MAG TPA: hypothetical protein VIH71_06885 [Solirubrobacteraceae bacterium]
MPVKEPAAERNSERVEWELRQLRKLGLWPAVRAGGASVLADIAYEQVAEHSSPANEQTKNGTADERHRITTEQIKVIIEAVAEQLDGGRNEAVAELFALTLTSDEKMPDVDERRSRAAAKLHYTPLSFKRYQEADLLKDLTKLLLDRYCSPVSAEQSVRTDHPAEEPTPEPPEKSDDSGACPDQETNSQSLQYSWLRSRPLLVAYLIVAIAAIALGGRAVFFGNHAPDTHPVTSHRISPKDVQLEATIYAGNITRHINYRHVGVVAEPGEQLALYAYYDNLESPDSGRDALDVRMKIGLNQQEATTTHTIHLAVSAQSAPEVKATTHIFTSTPTRLVLVPGSVTWKHDIGTNAHRHWITTRLSDFTVTSPIGTIIDPNEQPSNSFSATVLFQVAVAGTTTS